MNTVRMGFYSDGGRGLRRCMLVMFALLALALISTSAWADDGGTQAGQNYSNFLNLFLTTTTNWAAPLRTLATSAFWSLAFLELNIAFWPLVLQGADLGEFVWAMVKLILFLGFFYALVLNGASWMTAIINSFSQAGAQAGGNIAQLTPATMLTEGIQAALTIMNSTSFLSPFSNVGLELAALIVVICFAIIAAVLGLLLLESYITIGAATFFFAFGGCRFTSDYARQTFQGAVVIGAKLFLLQLLAATANPLIQQWVSGYQADNANTFGLIGLVGIFTLACAMIPTVVNRLMGGAGHGGALGTVMGAAGMLTGAGAAVGAASALAGAQLGGGAGSAAASLAGASTSAPGGIPAAVSGMPGMGGLGGLGGGNAGGGAGGGDDDAMPTGSVGSGPLSGRASSGGPGGGGAQAKPSGAGGGTSAKAFAGAVAKSALSSAGQAVGHGVLTALHTAGHMAMHVGSSNPGRAAADEMRGKLAGYNRPQAPGGAGGEGGDVQAVPAASSANLDSTGSISGGDPIEPATPPAADASAGEGGVPPASPAGEGTPAQPAAPAAPTTPPDAPVPPAPTQPGKTD